MIATWLGAETRPLFGVWHVPDGGRARSVAVLCAPLGREQGIAHRSYRILAEELSHHGVAALRFDYFGTADSSGDSESPDLVAAWLDSIDVAVATARRAGAEHVTVIGLRMGAVLAGLAAARGGVDAFVAWDPCASGKAFLREERALRRLSLSDVPLSDTDGAVEGSGSTYSAQTAGDLGPLRLPDDLTLPTLLLLRDDRPTPKTVAPLTAQPNVTQLVADEQDAFLDVIDLDAMPPRTTIDAITSWVSAQVPEDTTWLRIEQRSTARVGAVDGVPVTEQILALGPNRLFAIASTSAADARTTVLFTPTATNYHPGVARIAVDTGRRLASTGLRSVRYDPFDLGDSPSGSSPEGPRYYTTDSTRDAVDASRACTEAYEGELVLVGLCSGAWAANMAIAEVRPAAAYLLNPLVWSRVGPVMGPSAPCPPSRATRIFNRLQHLPGVERIAVALWRSLATVGVVDGPATLLDQPAQRDSRITVLLGPWEHDVMTQKSSFGSNRRLAGRAHLRFVSTELQDHSLHTAALRHEVLAQLPQWIREDTQPDYDQVRTWTGPSHAGAS